MSNRRTAIGFMFRTDPDAARAELARVIRRHAGEVVAIARDFGIHRRQLIRLVHRANLWRLVWTERSRKRALAPLYPAHGDGRATRSDQRNLRR